MIVVGSNRLHTGIIIAAAADDAVVVVVIVVVSRSVGYHGSGSSSSDITYVEVKVLR